MSGRRDILNRENSNNSSQPDQFLDLPVRLKDSHVQIRSLTNEEWLDSLLAAAYLKISVGTLRNMTSSGQIPYHKLGKRNRYRTEELRRLLLSQKKGESYGN